MSLFPAYRHWQPTPLIKFSTLTSIAALVAIALYPEHWPWAVAVIVADHLLLTVAGLLPRCALLGSNWTSLPQRAAERGEIAITIDDGPNPDITPAVLDILDRHGAKATFFCIGENARRYPELCRDIVRRGHAVENHTMHHRHHFAFRLLGGYVKELETAQQTLSEITGSRPTFFRAPAGLRNPMLDPVLARLGLQLASWTRRGFDTVERDPQVVLAKLLHNLRAGDILLLHDHNAALAANGKPVIVEVLPPLLAAIAAARLKTVTLAQSKR